MSTKTTEERIESVQEQIRQLENQKKKLMQEQKERERKARTKRLIERGAILESLVPEADILTNEKIKAFLEKTIQTEYARKILDTVNQPGNALAASEPTPNAPDGDASLADKSASTTQGTG